MNIMIEHYQKNNLKPCHTQVVNAAKWNDNEITLKPGRYLEIWNDGKREIFSARDFYIHAVSEQHYTIKRR